MLVEDNVDHAELVMRELQNHRVANRIIHLRDGQAALDCLLNREQYTDAEAFPRPDVILLDLRLPKIDGLHVLRTIKESETLRTIPVVVLTTSNAERDLMQAYQYHANSFIVKPVNYATFRELMNDLGFYWMVWNARPN
jgi:CheY-like chemotaxis protein